MRAGALCEPTADLVPRLLSAAPHRCDWCRLAEVIRLTPVVLRLPGGAARPQASPSSKRWCNNFPKGWRNGGGADWLETAKTGCRASKKRANVALEGFAARGNRHESVGKSARMH